MKFIIGPQTGVSFLFEKKKKKKKKVYFHPAACELMEISWT